MISITVITSCSASNQPTLQSQSSDSTCVATVLSHSRDIQTSRLVLCNSARKRQEFLELLPEESTHRRDLPPTIFMITGGNLGWTGVSEGRWMPSILL